jgi:hypothetical protein
LINEFVNLCPNFSRVAGEIQYDEPIDSGDEQYRYEVHLLVRDAGAGFDVEEKIRIAAWDWCVYGKWSI